MENTIENINYKGCTIKIYPDEDATTPNEHGDKSRLVYYYDQLHLPDDEVDYDTMREIIKEGKRLKGYWFFPVYIMDHSGLWLSMGKSVADPQGWDTSLMGGILVEKKEFRLEKSAHKFATALLESWNTYLSGGVVGFVAETPGGDDIHSCWGFYDIQDAIEAAKSEIDCYVERKRKKHMDYLKSCIQNAVPLQYRKPFTI